MLKRNLVVVIAAMCTGCLPNKIYRPLIPPEKQITCGDGSTAIPPGCSVQMVHTKMSNGVDRDVPVAFVEFDDVGQAYRREQMNAAENTIRQQHPENGNVVTIVFIHGWKNNASDDSNNVPGFRQFLQEFQMQFRDTKLVGIYMGWRGGVTNAAVFKEFTYWNRRDAATYIPGSNMSETLLRIAQATKGSNYCLDSKLILVGHSFGGLVLERTITQYLTRRVVEGAVACPEKLAARLEKDSKAAKRIPSLADLIVFVNEAAAATEGIQLLTMLHEKVDTEEQKFPIIVSITSQGDTATRFILPVGQGANLLFSKKSLRGYGADNDTDPFGITTQRTYYLRSTAHIPQLESHVVARNDPNDVILNAYKERGYTCASLPGPNGKPVEYYVVPLKESDSDKRYPNDTPYWVMEMPTEIVPDHSHIFRLEFGRLLQAFVQRQAQDERPAPEHCFGAQPAKELLKMHNTITLK